MEKVKKVLLSRMMVMLYVIVFEILILVWLCSLFPAVTGYISIGLRVLSVLVVLAIIRNSRHLSSDLMWIILILLFPVGGTALYLFLILNLVSSRTFKSIRKEEKKTERYAYQDPHVFQELVASEPSLASLFRFIPNEGFSFYKNTQTNYYPLGELGFPHMLADMKQAKKYIFMEYFIIEPGRMWNQMLEILEEKVKEGVEVRVMYDDMGSMNTLPFDYVKELEAKGIKATSFNRINPALNIVMNHRDHRKIMVIDGVIGYSGGINLADEYINKKERFGHWKDNVIRLEGPAVWGYLKIFLTNWNALRHEDNDYTIFQVEGHEMPSSGFVAPYAETPLDDELTSQCIYEDILNSATRYVYIMTPYLIIDSSMVNTLIHTAKKGVDVRLILPGVPDKKVIWDIGRSFYKQLMDGGVKIYQYRPGFVHSKVFVSDDRIATVGTINLDYRSLYLHFENGTLLFKDEAVQEVVNDMQATLKACDEIHKENVKFDFIRNFILSVLRIFAPML